VVAGFPSAVETVEKSFLVLGLFHGFHGAAFPQRFTGGRKKSKRLTNQVIVRPMTAWRGALPRTIEVVVRLTISDEDYDVNRLERRVRAARDEAGRRLLVQALEALDVEAVENHAGATRQRWVERHLDTTLGHLVFRRWRVKVGGKTTCVLDRLLNLDRHSRASPGLKKRGAELAIRMTYREAAAVLSEESGTPVSAQSVHSWVQPLGRAAEERELAVRERPRTAPEVMVAEWDDTMLRSQEKGEEKFAVKLGIGYSQKEREGAKRWKLVDKVVYGGVEEPEIFAQRFYTRAEASFQMERVRHVVVKGDGAEWICQGAAQVFPGHVFQLDRWHLLDRIAQFAGQQPRLWRRLRRWVFQGRVKSLLRSLRFLVGREARSEQARQDLLGYVTRHVEAITAVDRIRDQVSPQARLLLTHGTGAMEKNIEVVIGRRFKRWGMRWTRRGAHRLLKLRLWIAECGKTWFEALCASRAQLTNA
jgi:Uncharacterised protein family (UPF0236)